MVDDVGTAAPTRREAGFAALSAVALTAAFTVIAAVHGALGAARNDDWAYYRITYRLAAGGGFHLDGWTQTMLIGQSVLAWPIVKIFGPNIAPLQIEVAVLGAAGLWATWMVIRSFLPRWGAGLAVACFALGPIYGSLSVSFMSDVPAFALEALCLLAGLRAMRSAAVSIPWFLAALALAFVAFTIREYGAAAGAAVCVVAVLRSRSGGRARSIVVISGAWFGVLVGVYLWRRALPGQWDTRALHSAATIRDSFIVVWRSMLVVAMFCAPALLILSPVRLATIAWRHARWLTLALVGAVIAATATSDPEFLGNYFWPNGAYSESVQGVGPSIIPTALWRTMRAVGPVSLGVLAICAAVAIVDRRRERRPERAAGMALAGWFSLATIVLVVGVRFVTEGSVFDRYVFVIVPFVAAAAIAFARSHGLVTRPTQAAAGLAMTAFAVLGLVFVDASAAFDGAKWRLAQRVERRGYAAATIDGGYEWFGYHQPDPIHQRRVVDDLGYWVTLFSARPVCAVDHFDHERAKRVGMINVTPTRGDVIDTIDTRTLFGVHYRLTANTRPC
jgi:hypothetical protein